MKKMKTYSKRKKLATKSKAVEKIFNSPEDHRDIFSDEDKFSDSGIVKKQEMNNDTRTKGVSQKPKKNLKASRRTKGKTKAVGISGKHCRQNDSWSSIEIPVKDDRVKGVGKKQETNTDIDTEGGPQKQMRNQKATRRTKGKIQAVEVTDKQCSQDDSYSSIEILVKDDHHVKANFRALIQLDEDEFHFAETSEEESPHIRRFKPFGTDTFPWKNDKQDNKMEYKTEHLRKRSSIVMGVMPLEISQEACGLERFQDACSVDDLVKPEVLPSIDELNSSVGNSNSCDSFHSGFEEVSTTIGTTCSEDSFTYLWVTATETSLADTDITMEMGSPNKIGQTRERKNSTLLDNSIAKNIEECVSQFVEPLSPIPQIESDDVCIENKSDSASLNSMKESVCSKNVSKLCFSEEVSTIPHARLSGFISEELRSAEKRKQKNELTPNFKSIKQSDSENCCPLKITVRASKRRRTKPTSSTVLFQSVMEDLKSLELSSIHAPDTIVDFAAISTEENTSTDTCMNKDQIEEKRRAKLKEYLTSTKTSVDETETFQLDISSIQNAEPTSELYIKESREVNSEEIVPMDSFSEEDIELPTLISLHEAQPETDEVTNVIISEPTKHSYKSECRDISKHPYNIEKAYDYKKKCAGTHQHKLKTLQEESEHLSADSIQENRLVQSPVVEPAPEKNRRHSILKKSVDVSSERKTVSFVSGISCFSEENYILNDVTNKSQKEKFGEVSTKVQFSHTEGEKNVNNMLAHSSTVSGTIVEGRKVHRAERNTDPCQHSNAHDNTPYYFTLIEDSRYEKSLNSRKLSSSSQSLTSIVSNKENSTVTPRQSILKKSGALSQKEKNVSFSSGVPYSEFGNDVLDDVTNKIPKEKFGELSTKVQFSHTKGEKNVNNMSAHLSTDSGTIVEGRKVHRAERNTDPCQHNNAHDNTPYYFTLIEDSRYEKSLNSRKLSSSSQSLTSIVSNKENSTVTPRQSILKKSGALSLREKSVSFSSGVSYSELGESSDGPIEQRNKNKIQLSPFYCKKKTLDRKPSDYPICSIVKLAMKSHKINEEFIPVHSTKKSVKINKKYSPDSLNIFSRLGRNCRMRNGGHHVTY